MVPGGVHTLSRLQPSLLSSSPKFINMGWTAPHPRRRPDPAEIEEERRKIEELDQHIGNLADQIAELTQLRLALEQERLGLEQERLNRQSFIAPFRRMPTEILCEIAGHAVRQGTPQLLLNQICSVMRDAVNGFKAFWNHIYITKTSDYLLYEASCRDYPQRNITCKNRQWLQVLVQRASPSSLFIRIAPSAFTAEMLEPLIHFSRYIDTLEMNDGGDPKSIPLVQLSAMNFSGVQSFSYTTQDPRSFALINILDVLYRFCPHKITLRLHLWPVAFYPVLAHSIVEKVSKLILSSGGIVTFLQ
jgi:hypothetical protein